LVAVFSLSFLIVQPANADPITGEVAFVGLFTVTGGSNPLDLANATGIDFTYGVVAQATGDFNPINGVVPLMSPVTLNDFTFQSFAGVDPLWAVGVFSFALNTLTSVNQGENYLALTGTGIVSSSKTGLDPTSFNWSFSGDNSGGTLQLFSSTASPSVQVAEPSEIITLVFLVIGVGALCLWSSRARTAIRC
jgi:hypothetical protein